MRALPVLAALLAAGTVLAPAASAQNGGSPFSPIPPAQPAPAPEPTPAPAPTPSSGNPNDEQVSTAGVLGLFAAGILVIVLIGFFIMRDARRSLPKSKRRGPRKQPASPSGSTAARPASGKRPPPPRRPTANARKRRKRQKRRTR